MPPSAPPGSNPDEWIATSEAQPAAAAVSAHAPEIRMDELVASNENPILRSAGPLLLLLGRLRVALARASFASLMEQVAEAIKFFERDIRSAGISEQQANSAKYLICATADDIVQNIPTEDRHVWTQYSMLSRFFGERVGGVRFFDELTRLKQDPLLNYNVLELQHTCLALGFQGIHRTSAGGISTLQHIQRDLYETLRRVRPKSYRELSPRWQGQKLASRRRARPGAVVGSGRGDRSCLVRNLFPVPLPPQWRRATPPLPPWPRCRTTARSRSTARSSYRRCRRSHRRHPNQATSPNCNAFAPRLRLR